MQCDALTLFTCTQIYQAAKVTEDHGLQVSDPQDSQLMVMMVMSPII